MESKEKFWQRPDDKVWQGIPAGFALSIIIVYVVHIIWGIDVPVEVGLALSSLITSITTFVVQYLIPNRHD